MVAIGIEDIKVAHAISVVLWWLEYFCSARSEFGVKGIHVFHKMHTAQLPGGRLFC